MARKREIPAYSGSFGRFETNVLDLSEAILHRHDSDAGHRKEVATALGNMFHGRAGPRAATPRPLNPHDEFGLQLFKGCNEISTAVRALRLSVLFYPRYADCPPHIRKRISRTEFQRYHVEKWLSETYILRERLKMFFTRLSRRFRAVPETRGRLEKRAAAIESAFDKMTTARGTHTHESRYSDSVLDRIQLLELLGKSSSSKTLRTVALKVYLKEAQSQGLKGLKSNTEYLETVVDVLFDGIDRLFFDAEGKLLRKS